MITVHSCTRAVVNGPMTQCRSALASISIRGSTAARATGERVPMNAFVPSLRRFDAARRGRGDGRRGASPGQQLPPHTDVSRRVGTRVVEGEGGEREGSRAHLHPGRARARARMDPGAGRLFVRRSQLMPRARRMPRSRAGYGAREAGCAAVEYTRGVGGAPLGACLSRRRAPLVPILGKNSGRLVLPCRPSAYQH